jgi:hypothetical protein
MIFIEQILGMPDERKAIANKGSRGNNPVRVRRDLPCAYRVGQRRRPAVGGDALLGSDAPAADSQRAKQSQFPPFLGEK